MRKWLLGILVALILIWALGGILHGQFVQRGEISTTVTQGEYKITLESSKATYTSDEELDVWGSITYTGLQPFKSITHAAGIFYVDVYGVDNDYQQHFAMALPQLTTTLYRNTYAQERLEGVNQLDLPPGAYRIEARARFTTSQQSKVQVPITLQIEVVR